jgi:hypothetical protein
LETKIRKNKFRNFTWFMETSILILEIFILFQKL